MKKVAFLTCQDMESYVQDDSLLLEPMAQAGWNVDIVPWDLPRDWSVYQAIIQRTPWDYTEKLDQFLSFVHKMEAQGLNLHNSAAVTEWNYRKTYLLKLEADGVPIVPMEIMESFSVDNLASRLNGHEEWILKPTVSAAARDTFRFKSSEVEKLSPHFAKSLTGREVMLQPFLKEVLNPGEYSYMFFNGEFSHAILKTPKAGDFRVQEEFGGIITSYQPSAKEIAQARQSLDACGFDMLYARVDVVPYKGRLAVMELELIEPALYLRTNPISIPNFIKAFTQRCG